MGIDFENNSDINSRQMVENLLSGSMTNFGHSTGNCVWDLSCMSSNGKTISIEIKDRNFDHLKYGDIFAEEIKQTYTKQNYNFDVSLAVNVFTDGYVAINDLYAKDGKKFKKRCPKQTWSGGDHSLVLKDCISLPQRWLFKYEDGKFRKVK